MIDNNCFKIFCLIGICLTDVDITDNFDFCPFCHDLFDTRIELSECCDLVVELHTYAVERTVLFKCIGFDSVFQDLRFFLLFFLFFGWGSQYGQRHADFQYFVFAQLRVEHLECTHFYVKTFGYEKECIVRLYMVDKSLITLFELSFRFLCQIFGEIEII